jgi:hypothetical protein
MRWIAASILLLGLSHRALADDASDTVITLEMIKAAAAARQESVRSLRVMLQIENFWSASYLKSNFHWMAFGDNRGVEPRQGVRFRSRCTVTMDGNRLRTHHAGEKPSGIDSLSEFETITLFDGGRSARLQPPEEQTPYWLISIDTRKTAPIVLMARPVFWHVRLLDEKFFPQPTSWRLMTAPPIQQQAFAGLAISNRDSSQVTGFDTADGYVVLRHWTRCRRENQADLWEETTVDYCTEGKASHPTAWTSRLRDEHQLLYEQKVRVVDWSTNPELAPGTLEFRIPRRSFVRDYSRNRDAEFYVIDESGDRVSLTPNDVTKGRVREILGER